MLCVLCVLCVLEHSTAAHSTAAHSTGGHGTQYCSTQHCSTQHCSTQYCSTGGHTRVIHAHCAASCVLPCRAASATALHSPKQDAQLQLQPSCSCRRAWFALGAALLLSSTGQSACLLALTTLQSHSACWLALITLQSAALLVPHLYQRPCVCLLCFDPLLLPLCACCSHHSCVHLLLRPSCQLLTGPCSSI